MAEAAPTSVLVVDDEWIVRLDLAQRIELAGYRVHEASSAVQAIALLEKYREIRVVFTDIQMPGTMDGIALSHYIRERWPPTILVVSSGNRAPAASELPENTDFIAKPVGEEGLAHILQRVQRKLSLA